MERKLTAILSADVEGYSRLMGEDEEATIRTLTSYRQVMGTLIPLHRGRVVDSPGDNVVLSRNAYRATLATIKPSKGFFSSGLSRKTSWDYPRRSFYVSAA